MNIRLWHCFKCKLCDVAYWRGLLSLECFNLGAENEHSRFALVVEALISDLSGDSVM